MPVEFKRTEIYWDDLEIGSAWTTRARTITEPDLVGFINIAWLTESLFTDHHQPAGPAVHGRLVPGSLVYAMAEGLTLSAVTILGFALLHTELEVKAPTYAGDTIHVRSSVTELKTTSKPDRAIARFRNEVVNQKGDTVQVYTALRMIQRRVG
jgi:acyl dehydratase